MSRECSKIVHFHNLSILILGLSCLFRIVRKTRFSLSSPGENESHRQHNGYGEIFSFVKLLSNDSKSEWICFAHNFL